MPEPIINKQMTAFEWLLVTLLSVIWGGAFFFTEVALVEFRPFSVVLGRVGFAAIALWIAVYVSGLRMPGRLVEWRAFFVMGGLNNLIPFSLIVWGQTEISSGLASILNATTPMFAVVIAHFLTDDEKMTKNRVLGIGAGVCGVAVMIGPSALAGLDGALLAQLAILGAAISYSFASIFGRRFSKTPPLVTAAGQVTASTVLLLPIALWVDKPWQLPWPQPATLGAILGISLICTACAYVIYFRILRTAGATNLMIVTLLIPPSAILLGVLFLGEVLTGAQITGMALIGLGLLAIDGRVFRKLTKG